MDNELLKIGGVTLRAVLTDIADIHVDAIVHPSGISAYEDTIELSPWVRDADPNEAISSAMRSHLPFKLGDVIVTPAGDLKTKYLISAIVMDWKNLNSELLSERVAADAVHKCVKLAVALQLKSIAFTPWGTRTGAGIPARIIAIMLQAITAEIQADAGGLECIYLISNNPEHLQWFVDRAFVFQVMFSQLTEVHRGISELNLPEQTNERIFKLLANLQNNTFIDIIGGDKITTGNISDSKGLAIGREASS